MARRRGKSSSKQDDSWLPLETSAAQAPRGFTEYVVPGVLLFIIVVGGSGLAWVCSDHQQTIDTLTETLESLHPRISRLQQQIGPDNARLANVGGFEERLVALEDAYAKAQRQVELALATSEQIKSVDLQSKVWSLQAEMNSKVAELQQNAISVAALNAIVKNKSSELEVVKQNVNTVMSANAELAMQVSGFSSVLSVTKLSLDEQIAIADGLSSQLEGQKEEIDELKALFADNQETVAANAQELIDIKELLESEQIKRTQKLEKQLRSLYKRLEDHQTNTESLHSHLTAQMEVLQIQLSKPSSAEEQLQVVEQAGISDKKEKVPKNEQENIEDEEFVKEQENTEEKPESTGEDKDTGEDELNREREAVEEVETDNVEAPLKEIEAPSEKLDIDVEIEDDAAEEVDITAEVEMLHKENMVTNEKEDPAVDENEIRAAPEDPESAIVGTYEEAPEESEIRSEDTVPSKIKKQPPSEDSDATDTEAVGKRVDPAPAQEKHEETDTHSDISKEDSSEEHAVEEIHSVPDQISSAEIKIQEDGEGQESSVGEILEDESEITSDENADRQVRDGIPAEAEQDGVEELTSGSAE